MKHMIANHYCLVVAVGSRSDARDEAISMRVIKRFETPTVGSRADASDAFFRDLISIVITPLHQ